jgi:putative two-component system response regulator
VRILVNEIKQGNEFHLNKQFCRDLIKAAPMHDLGKITINDAILRKPGRFTPEEYEIMKSHSGEGAKIVHEILKGTDDDEFRKIAENVAHYHHERWDGKGYPEGLKGDEIPLEARIMAIADVYDALVSKRAYYVAARPKLEAYYRESFENSNGSF